MEEVLQEFRDSLKKLEELQIKFVESVKSARVTKLPVLIDIAERNLHENEKAISRLRKFIEEEEKDL